MKYYQELTLIPQAQIGKYFIWSKLYTQLHLAFVEMQNTEGKVPVGASFPEYVKHERHVLLGSKLRLFAENEKILEALNITKWLMHLSDYVHYTAIREVPNQIAGYSIYHRHQPELNAKRLARRYAKRHRVSVDDALARYVDIEKNTGFLPPFIRLKSMTNKHDFNLFIKRKSADELIDKGFTTYGLSRESSVPEF